NVHLKLRPNLDGASHQPTQGFANLVTIGVGTDTTVLLRYTYGRDLVGHPGYIGYSLITLKNVASDDGGTDGGPNNDTTVATFQGLDPQNWYETVISITTSATGAGTMSLSLNNVAATGATNVTVPIFPADTAYVEVGNHGFGVLNTDTPHFIDDVRFDVF